MRVTASGLERAMRCPESMILPVVSSTSEAAEKGTWRHAFLASLASGLSVTDALAALPEQYRDICAALPIEELPVTLTAELAVAYDVSSGKARIIGTNVDRNYGELAAAEIAGTADVVGLSNGTALVLDWKSVGSRDRASDSYQLRFLALAVARIYGVETVRAEIVRLGDGGEVYRNWHVFEAMDLDVFAAELRAWLASDGGRGLSEGPWCHYCSSFAFCPAKASLAVAVAEGKALAPAEEMLPLTPTRAGVAWVRLRAAKQLIAHVERAVIATLDENQGELPLPDGRTLRRVVKPGNERLDGDVTYAAVRDLYGQAVADAAVERHATKAAIKNALRPLLTKRGELGKGETAVLERVRAAGGVERKPSSSIEEVP